VAAIFDEGKVAGGEPVSMREVSMMDMGQMDATLGLSSIYAGGLRGTVECDVDESASHSSSTSASHSSCPSPDVNSGTKRFSDGTEKTFPLSGTYLKDQLEEELEGFAIDNDLDELASWWKVSTSDISPK